MKNIPPSLTPRLMAVAELVPQCGCFADIGTDHAYLPVYLCMTGVCERAVASDIGKGPLLRAEETVARYGMEARISLRLGAGLDTLERGEADCVSVAGMGGLLIAGILENGRDKLMRAEKIILQPMTAAPELREYLWGNGWIIEREGLAAENGKIYNIMTVRCAEGAAPRPGGTDIYIGKALADERPPHFDEYLSRRIKKLRIMLDGLSRSRTENADRMESLKKLLSDCEKLI